MHFSFVLPIAVVGEPLFGNQWLALLAMLGLIALFILGVAGLGRLLAATHPDAPAPTNGARASAAIAEDSSIPPAEILAVIAAAVATIAGAKARVTAIKLTEPAPSVESLMLHWSLEGRRQIYSSHKVR